MAPKEAHFAVRLESRDRSVLDDQAKASGVSASQLVRRYVLEGIRMDRHPDIVFITTRTGRRPVLATYSRLGVDDVVETWTLHGGDIDRTAKYFAIEPELVRAALSYYAEFRPEIEDRLERRRFEAEQVEKVFGRQKAPA